MEAVAYDETFGLLAELALGLAGFGGVAAAFGGRERAFRATELIRLRAVFFSGGIVLACALCVQTLLAIEALADSAVQVAGGLAILGQLATSATNLRTAFQRADDPDSSSERWALQLSVFYTVTVLILSVVCIATGQAWTLIGASTIQLLFGLWMFTRILTRPN
ncbi:MAG: hypothetical protein AAGC67_00715 [Myxococcota bacterium]